MSLRIQQSTQNDVTPSPSAKPESTPASGHAANAYSTVGAMAEAQDTASISSGAGQLAGDPPIRQERVEPLRAQIEAGTYTVNPKAVATAMFQNLFRS